MSRSSVKLCHINGLLLIVLFHFFLSDITFAQSELPPLGKVELKDLVQKKYGPDPSVEAMYLVNEQESEVAPMVGYDFKTIIRKRERIKIFNRKGFKYASIKLELPGRKKSALSDIVGYIYQLDTNGNILTTRIDEQEVYKSSTRKGEGLVSFAFPNVTEGCIVEFTYTYIVKSAHFLPTWKFQSEIPTDLAYCKISIPDFVNLEHKITSNLDVAITNDKKIYDFRQPVVKRTFFVKNIPAFRAEPMMGSINKYYQRIEFAMRIPMKLYVNDSKDTLTKWGVLNRLFTNVLAIQLGTDLKGTDTIATHAKKIPKLTDRISYLFEAVKNQIKWDSIQTFDPDDIGECWKKKEGNSAELNTLLFYLAKKSDVTCFPLLFSSRENGPVDKEFVSLAQFDGLDVVVVDSTKTYVLDATQKNLSPFVTPYNTLNTEGFLIDGTKGQWVVIADNRILFKQSIYITASLDPTGLITGNAKLEYFDYARDVEIRKKKNEKDIDELSDLQRELGFIANQVESIVPDQLVSPMTVEISFTMHPQQFNNYLAVNPAFMSSFRKNPFTSNSRNFDIDLGSSQSHTIVFNLKLDPNFVVEQLPKNTTLLKSDSTISFKRISDQDGGIVRSLIRIEYKESQFPKSEYTDLKGYFSSMCDLLNEPILLIKRKD